MNWFTWNRIIRLLMRYRRIFSESFLPQYFTVGVFIAVFWKKEKRNEENISLRKSDLFFNKIVSCDSIFVGKRVEVFEDIIVCIEVNAMDSSDMQIFRNNRYIYIFLSPFIYLYIYFSFVKFVFLSRGQYFSQVSLKQLFYFQPNLPTYLFRDLIWFIQKFIK